MPVQQKQQECYLLTPRHFLVMEKKFLLRNMAAQLNATTSVKFLVSILADNKSFQSQFKRELMHISHIHCRMWR